MGIQKYQAFLKTVETGSITIAAKQLGYTQSAVSKMIQDLEAEWDISLLSRSRKGVALTSQGLSVIDDIRAIVRDYENLCYNLADVHGTKQGTIRLGSFSSVSASFLPSVLKSFHELYPGIQIQLFHGEYSEISEWLRRGVIDCGFIGSNDSGEFDAAPIFRDSLVAIVPQDHPLAQAEVYPIERLPEENFIGLKEERDYDFAQFFDKHQVHPVVTYEVPSDLVLLSMVESGLGISLVYDMILKHPRFNVVRLPLDHTKERTVSLALGKASKNSSIVNLFMDHVLSFVKENDLL